MDFKAKGPRFKFHFAPPSIAYKKFNLFYFQPLNFAPPNIKKRLQGASRSIFVSAQ